MNKEEIVKSSIDKLGRAVASQYWKMSLRNTRNRESLYKGKHGLRGITFHSISDKHFEGFKRVIEWCQDNSRLAQPADADKMLNGELQTELHEDQVVITLDDGHSDNHRAAEWLHGKGVRATFFIVPSFVGRSNSQYIEYHYSNGVSAYPLQVREAQNESQGLCRSQLTEMVAMGHRIAAHNYAHRDIGTLTSLTDLSYEIINSINAVADLTGQPCKDFAIGFGQNSNLSNMAIEYLSTLDCRVYMCFRGLNIPGISPRYFLRHGYDHSHPFGFTALCLQCGADHNIYAKQKELAHRVGIMPGYV